MWRHLLNGIVYILALCQLYRIWLYTGLALCKSIRSPAIHRAIPRNESSRNFCSRDLSLPGTFVLGERKFPGTCGAFWWGSLSTDWWFIYFVVGSCRQKRQLLLHKIVDEQRRLLGKAAASQRKCEHSSSTLLADDNSLLLSEVDTGFCWFSACCDIESVVLPSALSHCWLGIRKSIRPVKNWVMGEWWRGAGVVICLERGANDLHMIQLMPLPRHLLLC